MWEGRQPFPLNNKIKFTSFELGISKIVRDLVLITLLITGDSINLIVVIAFNTVSGNCA